MTRIIYVDELDKKLMYYYRNDFPVKSIVVKTGVEEKIIRSRLSKLRRCGMLKRWWEEDERES